MPNKLSDKRRRVVYIEDKDKWEIIKEAAAREGVSPSSLVRIATHQLCEKLKDPKFRVIKPLFE